MKRQRGRGRKSNGGGGHHQHHNHNRNFESNGPDVKIRGSASHVYEKYQQLARDASSAGDRVAAESYLQHAEHYFRLMRSQQQHQQQNQQQHQQNQQHNPQAQNRPDDIGNRDYSAGGYANGRDEFDEAPEPIHTAQPQPVAAAASPLDVVDPEAVEAASGGDRGEERSGDEPRSRRRRRRRYEGGAPSGAGDLGAEAAEAGESPTFDRASSN